MQDLPEPATMLPFDRQAFFDVFAAYNAWGWPTIPVAYGIAGGILVLLLTRPAAGGRLVLLGLAAMWGWTGLAYHGLHFSRINPAAWGFAAVFVLQSLLFLLAATPRVGTAFRRPVGLRAGALMSYSAILYPVLGLPAGHRAESLPMFGVTPCPLTIFSLGVLLCADRPVPWWLLAIPLSWAAIGGSAAVLLEIPQDWMLPVTALAVLAIRRFGGDPLGRRRSWCRAMRRD